MNGTPRYEPKTMPICKAFKEEDKETILFELGFAWGVCRKLDDDDYAYISDSFDIIRKIISKY